MITYNIKLYNTSYQIKYYHRVTDSDTGESERKKRVRV